MNICDEVILKSINIRPPLGHVIISLANHQRRYRRSEAVGM